MYFDIWNEDAGRAFEEEVSERNLRRHCDWYCNDCEMAYAGEQICPNCGADDYPTVESIEDYLDNLVRTSEGEW